MRGLWARMSFTPTNLNALTPSAPLGWRRGPPSTLVASHRSPSPRPAGSGELNPLRGRIRYVNSPALAARLRSNAAQCRGNFGFAAARSPFDARSPKIIR